MRPALARYSKSYSHKPMPDGHLGAMRQGKYDEGAAALTKARAIEKSNCTQKAPHPLFVDILAFDCLRFERYARHNTQHARPTESCPQRTALSGPPLHQSSAPAVVDIPPDCRFPAVLGRRPQTHSLFPRFRAETGERSRYV
jgi:hypothetical protein